MSLWQLTLSNGGLWGVRRGRHHVHGHRSQAGIGAVLRLPSATRPTARSRLGRTRWPRSSVSVPSTRIWCHWLDRADYLSVADTTDYNIPKS